jgi:ABC-2 type transport system permease protein
VAQGYDEVRDAFLQDEADIIVEIPPRFGNDLMKMQSVGLHFSVNAINGSKAGIVNNYALAIVQDYNREIRTEMMGMGVGGIEITARNWFNPDLNFKTLMVPGILVLLVTMVGLFLSGMNIVREKEIGTIEQLNVTPIRKYQFILGKLLPFWVIAMFDLLLGLVLGRLAFGVPMVGSPLVVLGFAAVYLVGIQGIGLLISTITDTQQQAMFIAWFFMVIFVLMGGLFTPIESMPEWAQTIAWFNPVAWFVEVIRMVMLKGSGFADVQLHFLVITAMTLAVLTGAVLNYSKKS